MINNTNAKHRGRRVLIAGGGIAGLSLARALKDAGHNPLVIERSREWPTTDTAHYLPVNALRALDQLGLGEAVTAAAHPISRQRVTGARGRTLVDLPVSSIWGNGGQSVAIRRNALHELLQAATPDVAVRRGTTIAARLRNGAIKLSDGSIEQCDVLVGADGADSVVRTAGIGGTAPQHTSRWCWRFIADGWSGEEDTWRARLAPGRSLVTMPLGDWRNYFDDFGMPVTDLLTQGGHAYATPITEVDQPYAFLGRTVLIGDAAHAMSHRWARVSPWLWRTHSCLQRRSAACRLTMRCRRRSNGGLRGSLGFVRRPIAATALEA